MVMGNVQDFSAHTSVAATECRVTPIQKVDAIKVGAEPRQRDRARRRHLQGRAGRNEVLTGTEITKQDQAAIKDDLSFFNVFLMVFAMIALFVGSFIIYNSFSILVAQRTKEMALMRAIGASRKQVTRSVLLEAGVVGLIASALGLVAGVGVAAGLKMLLSGIGIDIPAGGIVLTSKTVIVSVIAGLASAWRRPSSPHDGPRRFRRSQRCVKSRSTRAAEAASAPSTEPSSPGSGPSQWVPGCSVERGSRRSDSVRCSCSSESPCWDPSWPADQPCDRFTAAPLEGMSGTLARQNAMRNPKRTSATAAALMIGVALVGFITILASSTKASVAKNVEKTFNGDLVVSSNVGGVGGLSPKLAEQLAALPQLDAVTGFRIAPAEIDGSSNNLIAADPQRCSRSVTSASQRARSTTSTATRSPSSTTSPRTRVGHSVRSIRFGSPRPACRTSRWPRRTPKWQPLVTTS
jgi:putative ABC transport system permease protein